MPWTSADVPRFTKSAKSRKAKRQWVHVANSMLKRTGNESKAIRAANSAVSGDCVALDAAGISMWLDSAFKAETSEETCPHCNGTGQGAQEGQTCTNCQGSGSISVPLDVPRNADANPDEEDPEEARERREELGEEEELEPLEEDAEDREFSAKERKSAAESGAAMKGGGFPIKNKKDLKNAMQALGRAKNRSATIAHIKKRARALGVELPENWPNTKDEAPMPTMQVLGDVQLELEMCDDIEFDAGANMRDIDGGYLSAYPRIARIGIQTYRGKECGKPDLEFVNVYRPEDEVFAKDAVHSYTHLPVTNSHPGVMVDAKNWNKYAKGDTGDEVLRDGNSVRVPMMLRDHETIKQVKDGKNQLSVGYVCDLDWTPGTTSDGEKFDAIQRNIKANHLAVVPAARGGPTLRIGDAAADRGDSTMSAILKNVVIDGVQVEMSDTAAQVVQRALMQAQQLADQFKKKAEKAEEEEENNKEEDAKKDAAIRAKDAKIATLEQQLKDAQITPAKLDLMVKDRQFVIDKARSLLGKTLIIDNRTVEDIRKQVVEYRLGAVANGWDDNQVRSSFDTLTAEVRPGGTIRDAANVFSRPHFVRDVDPKQAAYDEYDRDMANAWKGNQQRA